jgi:hypothetical protein
VVKAAFRELAVKLVRPDQGLARDPNRLGRKSDTLKEPPSPLPELRLKAKPVGSTRRTGLFRA